jgi:hypothetical protein
MSFASISLNILHYCQQLKSNRSKIADSALKISSFNERRIFWGAGRTFDALVRVGNLTINETDIIVDISIGDHFKHLFGFPVYKPDHLLTIKEKDKYIIIICAIEYFDDISIQAQRLGFSNLFKLF